MHVFEHDGEFVAAEARDRVAVAHMRAQARAGRLEHAVAGRVAHRIVDVLEAVEVEEQNRDAAAVAARAHDGVAQALAEQRAVGQSGQRVVVREVAQFLLGALAVGDVGEHADEMRARALRVAHFGQFQPAQEFLAVLASLPQLAAPVAGLAQRLAHVFVDFGRMLR
jgi:hypothetical protein